MLFLELFLSGVVGAVGLGNRVMVQLSQGICAELMCLGDFIKADEVLLFLATKQGAGIRELLPQTLIVLGEASLNILMHQVVLSEMCRILH